jgi:hypothetical protein
MLRASLSPLARRDRQTGKGAHDSCPWVPEADWLNAGFPRVVKESRTPRIRDGRSALLGPVRV